MNAVVPVGDNHFVTSNINPPFSASSIEDPGANWGEKKKKRKNPHLYYAF
jgi:hypothetical protein